MTSTTQGTVGSFSAAPESGWVFLDDGTRLPFGPEALEDDGPRLLRSGQRVALDLDATGVVNAVRLLTLGRGTRT